MSANQHCPNLPIEIWKEIMRQATFVPYELDTKLRPPSDLEYHHFTDNSNEYRSASMLVKSSISLVSRSWREMSLEYLFESLTFREDKGHLKSPITSWKSSPSFIEPNGPLRHVRRLKIVYGWDNNRKEELIPFFQLFTNLSIYIHQGDQQNANISFADFLYAVLITCGHSLRYLHAAYSDVSNLPELLNNCRQLERLDLHSPCFTTSRRQSKHVISLPSLHTLSVGSDKGPDIDRLIWDVPALQFTNFPQYVSFPTFVTRPSSLKLLSGPYCVYSDAQIDTLIRGADSGMEEMLLNCYGAMKWLNGLNTTFSSIQRLTVRYRFGEETIENVCRALNSFLDRRLFPSLSRIAVLTYQLNLSKTGDHVGWHEVTKKARGLSIEIRTVVNGHTITL